MKTKAITPVFVESVPARLEEGVLYISEKYKTAIHKCCCGCGSEVVTPLNQAGWKLHRSGNLVTLYPSIGNWSLPCKSHYWIRRNQVTCAPAMSSRRIQQVQRRDRIDFERHVASLNKHEASSNKQQVNSAQSPRDQDTYLSPFRVLWRWLKAWLRN